MTGVAPGTATVTATVEGHSGSSTITVIPVPVSTVEVSPSAADLILGATTQLAATPKDANGHALNGRSITWSTDQPSIATVDDHGVVTAVGIGSAQITAASEGKSGKATITVHPVPVASVTVTPSSPSLNVGNTVDLTATPKDQQGNALTGRQIDWKTSNGAVATVTAAGHVTAVAAGSATITATVDGIDGTAAITVTSIPVSTVTVSPPTASLIQGSTTQLSATARDGGGNALSGRTIDWSTSDAGIATVSPDGLVTAVSQGTATVTATSEGRHGQATVTVTPAPVATVQVQPSSAGLTVGQTITVTATPQDASGNPLTGRVVTWATSDGSVATVSGSGLVTAVGGGNATISATSEGKSGSSAIVVSNVSVATVEITPPGGSLEQGKAAALTATAKDAAGNVLAGRQFTWATSDATVVNGYTLNDVAVVVGVSLGTATITATSEGKSASVQVTVTPSTSGNLCAQIAGAAVVADDGNFTYLGRLTNQFDPQSIYNPVGTYGSSVSPLSIYDPVGQYGSSVSPYSAFNQIAFHPPFLVKNGSAIAYFTINTLKSPYVHPRFAETCNFP